MIEKIKIWFSTLNTAKRAGKKAPHKAVLLLSIIDLISEGVITTREIKLTDELINKFDALWNKFVKDDSYNCNITAPFWHMQNEPFWRIFEKYEGLTKPTSLKSLQENTIAVIDDGLYKHMKSPQDCTIFREVLLRNYLYIDIKKTEYMREELPTHSTNRLSELEAHITWMRSHGYEVPKEMLQHYEEEKTLIEKTNIENKLKEFMEKFIIENNLQSREIAISFSNGSISISIDKIDNKEANAISPKGQGSIRPYKHGALKITLPNGTTFQEGKSIETLIAFIKHVGPDKVHRLNILRNGVNLVSQTLSDKYSNDQKYIGDGWYVMGHTSTKYKVIDAEYISKAFNLNATIETFEE